ncbi:hypothetical protein ACFT7U_11570 [Streptomyces rochei]|uniref:hypothetical protein n=1 Tax=Streptomyces rochei TaxID=1928 RepID=UPI00363F0C00
MVSASRTRRTPTPLDEPSGFLLFRLLRLKEPGTVSLTAAMTLVALLAWVTQASAPSDGTGSDHLVAPTVRTGR